MKTEQQKPMTTVAAEMMIEAMKDLREKKIDAKDAAAIAQLGIGVVQAANAEIQFMRTTKAIPLNSGMGNQLQYLEPPAKS